MEAKPRAMRVGEFVLDNPAQRLWKDGQPVDLVPQVWAVLCVLLDRPGQVVSKEDLLAGAWPGIEVSDAALSQTVKRLRSALGDDAKNPRYVQTVHRRGFRLVAPLSIDAPQAALAASSSRAWSANPLPFVGRTAECDLLARLMATARQGQRQVVFVEGEAGIGKTELLRAFQSEHLAGGVSVAAAQCVEQQGGAEPYMPVLDALDRSVRAHPALLDVLRRYAPSWVPQMPWLIAPEEARGLEATVTDATRARMLREMARALEVMAAAQPMVLILEDLHWADPSTMDLLGVLARRRDPARLMVLGSYRPIEAIAYDHAIPGVARALAASGDCTRISLEPLTPEDVCTYLLRRFAPTNIPASIAGRIHARSEGNPLFLVAIVDHLVDSGLITREGDAWELRRPIDDADLRQIPNNLREMIQFQLEALEGRELQVLRAASVAAVEFRSASVAAALQADDTEEVESVCDRLVERRQLLNATGEQTWPDGTRTATYEFRHQLYRQSLYESLPAVRRRRFHQNIADRLERGFAADPRRIAAELAAHYKQSGDDAKAVVYFALAARQAHRRFADREAIELLQMALEHLERLPGRRERDVLELQLRTGVVLAHWLGDLDSSAEDETHLARIQQLTSLVDEGEGSFRLSSRLWMIYSTRSLPALAEPLADHMLAAAAKGELRHRIEALIAKGMTALMRGRGRDGLHHLMLALKVYGDGTPPRQAAVVDRVRWDEIGLLLHAYLCTALFFAGSVEGALRHLRTMIGLAESKVPPKQTAAAYLSAAGIHCLLGDDAAARQFSDRGLAVAEEHGLKSLAAAASPQRVWMAVAAGSTADAAAAIRDAWRDYEFGRAGTPSPLSPILLADACRIAGLADDGLSIVDAVWRETREGGLLWYDAELQRLRGELLLLGGSDSAPAEACFARALETAREQGCPLYELRAALSLARSRPDAGRDALAAAYRKLATEPETPDLLAARRILTD